MGDQLFRSRRTFRVFRHTCGCCGARSTVPQVSPALLASLSLRTSMASMARSPGGASCRSVQRDVSEADRVWPTVDRGEAQRRPSHRVGQVVLEHEGSPRRRRLHHHLHRRRRKPRSSRRVRRSASGRECARLVVKFVGDCPIQPARPAPASRTPSAPTSAKILPPRPTGG